jgi:hypothetical protein
VQTLGDPGRLEITSTATEDGYQIALNDPVTGATEHLSCKWDGSK